MTTITFESELDIKKKKFTDLHDFFESVSQIYDFSYEEYLEQKMQAVQAAPKSDFVSL